MEMTVKEAKQLLKEGVDDGIECPCCTQMVKMYKYNLFATSAAALIRLMKLEDNTGETHHHISKFAEAGPGYARASHFAELRYWGLAKPMDKKTGGTNSSGMWRITEQGRDFVNKRSTVRQKIRIFNNTLYGFEGDIIDIENALQNKFNYKEMMSL